MLSCFLYDFPDNMWRRQRDANPRLPRCERGALPAELCPQSLLIIRSHPERVNAPDGLAALLFRRFRTGPFDIDPIRGVWLSGKRYRRFYMEQILVIDAHTHVFPDKIARKASESIGHFYGIGMRYDGRVETLVDLSGACPIARSIVFSTATHPEQVRAINRFITATVSSHPQFAGLGTLHPGLSGDEIRAETDYLVSAGARGIILHPVFLEL